MKRVLLAVFAVSLSACTMMGMPKEYTFSKQPAGASLMSSGKMSFKKDSSMVMTSAGVSGLTPNTYYVAHYHNQGSAATNPCDSNGAPIMSSKMVGMTDSAGMLKLSGTVPVGDVASATYFNVHTAKDADGTPADGGVVCTSIMMN